MPHRFIRSVSLSSDRNTSYAEALKEHLSKQDFSIVMCVLTSNRADIYNTIKRITLCEQGIPSQVKRKLETDTSINVGNQFPLKGNYETDCCRVKHWQTKIFCHQSDDANCL